MDDHAPGRYALTRILRKANFEVREAGTGNEALRMVKAEHPDVILLDVNLPDMNGMEVCRRIKADPATARIPVLHLSASSVASGDQVRGLEGGADAYLTEPVEPDVLIATLKAVLRTHQVEDELSRLARQWQTTFNALSDGIAVLDETGKIVRCNRGMERLMGKPGSEILGRSYRDFHDETAFLRVRASRQREEIEVPAGDRWLHVRVEPLLEDSGTFTGAVCLVSDVTERRRMDEEYRQAQKFESIGVLAGGVAHDFNNLLTGVLGNASLALSDLPEEHPLRDKLQDIISASERAAHLTRQLLAYSGKGRYIVRPIELPKVISGIHHLLESSVPRKVRLSLDLSGPVPSVQADAHQMEQVLMNLVMNAAEAIGEDAGTIRISTGTQTLEANDASGLPPGEYVYLEVRDSGCGMDEQTTSRIFDPFFTTKFMGRGMGLAAVAGIVKAHQGVIRVSSTPGQGSTFRMLLPASESKEPAVAESRSLAGTGKVLVVDDEDVVRRMAKATLELYGYTVLLAENGRQAVEIVRQNPNAISCVIMDMAMPVMSGEEAVHEIERIEPGLRVIVSTGFDEAKAVEQFSGLRVASFLQKPYKSRDLAEKVKAVLTKQ
ncbi:MAG: response regulator [Candidatus Omnitrophica bacterium]|nr:response regulator [Candidatus Omnitrophota bacterium]